MSLLYSFFDEPSWNTQCNATETHADYFLPSFKNWKHAGTVVATVAFAFYFYFEDGPCHASQFAETYYLIGCMVIFGVCVCWYGSGASTLGPRSRVGLEVNQLLCILTLLHIYVVRIAARPLKRFYAKGDTRPFALHSRVKRCDTQFAARIAKQMDACLEILVAKSNWMGLEKGFPVTILAVLLLQRVCLNFSYTAKSWWLWIKICELVVVVGWLLTWTRSVCRRRAQKAKLQELVQNLVDNGDKALLRDVFEQSSRISDVLQFSDRKTFSLVTSTLVDNNLLDPFCVAVLLNALQQQGINRFNENTVSHLLLSCQGSELTQLKSILDSTGSYNNLFKLVYIDIKSQQVREEIISHLREQAVEVRAAAKNMGRRGVGIKVLSDIDDTLFCSGGSFPAGCDSRIPRGMVYPGCLSLFRILDHSWRPDLPSCNLVFLSARPHIYKDLSEKQSFGKFEELFSSGQLHVIPTLLPGSLGEGLSAMLKALFLKSHGWREVGIRKAQSFAMYKALYEEYDFIFFGDSGQGDLLAGQLMLKGNGEMDAQEQAEPMENISLCDESSDISRDSDVEHGQCCDTGRLLAVFIHQVLPSEKCLALELPEERSTDWSRLLAETGLHLVSSYVDAARLLHNKFPHIVPLTQLKTIVQAAISDFDDARLIYPEWKSEWGAMEEVLQHDLELAKLAIRAWGTLGMPSLIGTQTFLRQHSIKFSHNNALVQLMRRNFGTADLSSMDRNDDSDDDTEPEFGHRHHDPLVRKTATV